MQTTDNATLVERLRGAGFSPAMIRFIIHARVHEQFSARRKALLAQQEEAPYWDPRQRPFMDPKTMAAMRALSREQSDMIKNLLGSDGLADSDEREAYQRRQFGNLSRDKLDQLQNIANDYNELRTEIFATANGLMLPEDREKLALLEKEQRADMAAVMTPEEFENYELRSSSTASTLRSQLAGFKPTEQEFRAIFAAMRAAENKHGSLSTTGGNSLNQMRQVLGDMLEQTRSQLSPERYEDLKQATDPIHQMTNRLVARLDLPMSAARQVATLQQDATRRAAAIRSNQDLPAEQRTAQIAALMQETTATLTTVLGARGMEAYKQYGGQWLQSLQGPPARPPGAATPAQPIRG